MPFGVVGRLGQRNHVGYVMRGPYPHAVRGKHWEKWGGAMHNAEGEPGIGPAKTAEPIELPCKGWQRGLFPIYFGQSSLDVLLTDTNSPAYELH